jgi:hypothetical protein
MFRTLDLFSSSSERRETPTDPTEQASLSPYLTMKTDPVPEMLYLFRIPDDGQSPETQ